MDFDKILIAVDNSAFAMKAARAGFALAHSLHASVGIIYVVSQLKVINSADLGITPTERGETMLGEAGKTIQQYIDMYDGIDHVFKFTPQGLPEHEILNIAKEWKADMIVMGTHARSGLGRIFTGSVAEYVIRHAKVPVLITPPRMK